MLCSQSLQRTDDEHPIVEDDDDLVQKPEMSGMNSSMYHRDIDLQSECFPLDSFAAFPSSSSNHLGAASCNSIVFRVA